MAETLTYSERNRNNTSGKKRSPRAEREKTQNKFYFHLNIKVIYIRDARCTGLDGSGSGS